MSERITILLSKFFRQPSRTGRDKFLSRLFGIFNEEVVRNWCSIPDTPYDDIGRPYLKQEGESRGHTLDFTLRDRSTGRLYVAEMKCELEFEGYKCLRLTAPEQVRHHEQSAAFGKFMAIAKNPHDLKVTVATQPVDVSGAILVWGAATPQGADDVRKAYGLHDLLTIEDMLPALRSSPPLEWTHFLEERRAWSSELFEFLASGRKP